MTNIDIIKPDDNLEEQIINMCKRCEVIIEPTFFNYIHIHTNIHIGKRVHISTKKVITGCLTIHRVKHTKKGSKGLK